MAPKARTSTRPPGIQVADIPLHLQNSYIDSLTQDNAVRSINRSKLGKIRHGTLYSINLCPAPVPQPQCTANHHNQLAETLTNETTHTLLILLNRNEMDFWLFYTPSYLHPKEFYHTWTYLVSDVNFMVKRRAFANRIIKAHRLIQGEMDQFAAQGLFEPDQILPPVFRVCPETGNWYPTQHYTEDRDPFLHIHLKKYPPEVYNKVFDFSPAQAVPEANDNHKQIVTEDMATYTSYNDPLIPRLQNSDTGIIYSILKDGKRDGEVSNGPRGPWEMIPTTTRRIIGRSLAETDKQALVTARTTADKPRSNYSPLDNIFTQPPHTSSAPADAEQVTHAAKKPRLDEEALLASNADISIEEIQRTEANNTSIEIVCEVANEPASLPDTRPPTPALTSQPKTSTPYKATAPPLLPSTQPGPSTNPAQPTTGNPTAPNTFPPLVPLSNPHPVALIPPRLPDPPRRNPRNPLRATAASRLRDPPPVRTPNTTRQERIAATQARINRLEDRLQALGEPAPTRRDRGPHRDPVRVQPQSAPRPATNVWGDPLRDFQPCCRTAINGTLLAPELARAIMSPPASANTRRSCNCTSGPSRRRQHSPEPPRRQRNRTDSTHRHRQHRTRSRSRTPPGSSKKRKNDKK